MAPEKPSFRCIECGHSAQTLYTVYKFDVIKITQCEHCERTVDKYIEFENVIIFLDAILHKPQAYRHLLFNMDSKNIHFKVLMIFLLCDTYLLWDRFRRVSEEKTTGKDISLFYAALEIGFYKMLVISVVETCCFLCVLLGSFAALKRFFIIKSPFCLAEIFQGLVLSSYGKLFVVPAVMWGQTHSTVCLLLAKAFIFTSNTVALRVLCKTPTFVICLVLLAANLSSYSLEQVLLGAFNS